ncbi:MAG: HAD-superfamily hydrolase, subfamily variant 3 [Bryobacterales bacterium]|nr:HAD-superfamily hydrolase, subfamily variant 3 [Bryobacterales bacterium]
MDGVVIHSNPYHRDSWIAYNRRHGIETTEAMHQFMYGKRNDVIVRDFFGGGLTDEEVFAHGAAKEALYREMILPVVKEALVPGIREFLERNQHLPIGLATNAEPENARFTLENSGLAHLFRAVVTGQQVAHAKPHPEIYLKVSEILQVPPADCLVFEDSYSGVEAGRAAGMTVIGVRTTHPELPGTLFTIDNFLDPRLP